jgi:hypothetical protein
LAFFSASLLSPYKANWKGPIGRLKPCPLACIIRIPT